MPFAWINPAKQVVQPALPAWPAPPHAPAGYGDFASLLRRYAPVMETAPAADALYIAVPFPLLAPAVECTLARLRADGLAYRVNAWDCDDFAAELCQTLRKSAARAGINSAPLCGVLAVQQVNAWAGVSAGGYHAVCALVTDLGPYVVEPQNGQATPLECYPNRATLRRAYDF